MLMTGIDIKLSYKGIVILLLCLAFCSGLVFIFVKVYSVLIHTPYYDAWCHLQRGVIKVTRVMINERILSWVIIIL